jgi:protease I
MGKLEDKTVAFLATDGVEQVELTEPWKKVEDEGGTPKLVSLDSGEIQAFEHLDKADTFEVDEKVADASESDYDGLVLPGGVANPDFLRADEDASPSCAPSSRPRSRSPRSATAPGPWSRRTSCAAARSRPGRASRPTSETRAVTGWTRR